MTTVIDKLRDEHRNFEKLLCVLEQELDVFDRSEHPDYEIVQAVIAYFQDYPNRCHHPKEDLVFERLKARDPVAADSLGDLEAEHREEALRLQRLARELADILTDGEVLRRSFDATVRGFIAHERDHIEMEERALFPAAIKALQPEDWAAIESSLIDRRDPLASVDIEDQFRFLHERILQWEAEAQRDRA